MSQELVFKKFIIDNINLSDVNLTNQKIDG